MKQALFWSNDKNNIDDEPYETHQILMYGDLKEIRKMIDKKGKRRVVSIFKKNPNKIYTKSAFNFVAKFILKIKGNLDINKYVKSLY